MKPLIALQLWSIKNECQKNLEEALKKVKKKGYDGVEFAGYYGRTAEQITHILKETGLEVAGSHVPYDQLKEALDETLEFEQAIGNTRVVVPYASFETLKEWDQFIKNLILFSRAATERGIDLYYHNHAHEFSDIRNQDMLSYLSKKVERLYYEVDLYWLSYAGVVIHDWVDKHQEKIRLFHIKDKQVEPLESTELGTGVLPIKEYIEIVQKLQMPWVVIEQEAFQALTPLEAAEHNLNKLKQIIEEVYQ